MPPLVLLPLLLGASAAFVASCSASTDRRPRPVTTAADEERAVKASVTALNDAMTRRDLEAAMAVFEDGDGILLVGSDKGELFRGRSRVRGFLKELMGLPFTFSFETPDPVVQVNPGTAWLFADGAMVHTRADGTSRRTPYRFSVSLVRQGKAWKWQLFHGSVPGAE